MRHGLVSLDPQEETVFRPSELCHLIGPCERVSLPIGFIGEVAQAQSLTSLLDTVANWSRDILKSDRVSVVLRDEEGLFRVWALRGRTASRLDKSLPPNYGRLGRVISDQLVVLSPDLAHCTEPDGIMLRKAGLSRTVNAPLTFDGMCLGALNIAFEDAAAVSLTDAVTAMSIANWVAPAFAAFNCKDHSPEHVERQRQLAEQAQSESAMKSSFIANVSHEIRTPLNAMIGMAQILGGDDLKPSQAEKVEIILNSGRSLITTLNDILDLSKIEAGKLSLTPLRNHPAECFTETADLWRDRASQKGLSIALSLSDKIPDRLIYDAARVHQCVSNLLSNAIKFATDGVIDVRVTSVCADDVVDVRVDVEDRGCGIAEDALTKIFDPFEQVGSSVLGDGGGTGLGLAICRRLARIMGGDVTVRSTVGQGSVFSFSFMARTAPALEPRATDASAPTGAIPEIRIDRPLKLLLAEDVATNRTVVQMLLKKYNFDVTEAENGAIALGCLQREPFDLVLLDMQMPVMDGEETIQRIRSSNRPYQTVPVIALTASAMVGDRERFLRMGIDGYVPKPVEESSLVAEINEILRPRLR